MTNIINIAKKVILFLFGIFLIVWGYKVNAANSIEKVKEEKDNVSKKELEQAFPIPTKEEVKPVEESISEATTRIEIANQPEVEKKEGKKKENKRKKDKEAKQTVIESDTPEKASGTE